MFRPARMLIDLAALRSNVALARQCCGDKNIVAVLKANAYGHGAGEVANAIESQVQMFAVSSIEEALHLRQTGMKKEILLLEGCFSDDELEIARDNNFAVVFHNLQQVAALEKQSLSSPLSCWLKMDTGMHRLGMNTPDAKQAFQRLAASANSRSEVVMMTHLASSDLLQEAFTSMQLTGFQHSIENIGQQAKLMQTSISNSGAVLGWPTINCDWIRPGIMLYGVSPFSVPHPMADKLQPVMTLKSEVIAIRKVCKGEFVGYGNAWQAPQESVVATVAIGYGDGYPRNAKNGTPVLVNGKRANLVGRVSMDMLSIDVSNIPKVQIGDEVTLWGRELDVNEIAQCADTIGYELVTRMPLRVPKDYLD